MSGFRRTNEDINLSGRSSIITGERSNILYNTRYNVTHIHLNLCSNSTVAFFRFVPHGAHIREHPLRLLRTPLDKFYQGSYGTLLLSDITRYSTSWWMTVLLEELIGAIKIFPNMIFFFSSPIWFLITMVKKETVTETDWGDCCLLRMSNIQPSNLLSSLLNTVLPAAPKWHLD